MLFKAADPGASVPQLLMQRHCGQNTYVASLGDSSHCLQVPQQTYLTPSRCAGGVEPLMRTPWAGEERCAPTPLALAPTPAPATELTIVGWWPKC